MKMTMHIDEALLQSVMAEYHFSSKTEAVDAALREMDRRAKLRRFATEGLGLQPAELRAAFDPAYNLEVLRAAEGPVTYGTSDPG